MDNCNNIKESFNGFYENEQKDRLASPWQQDNAIFLTLTSSSEEESPCG